MERYELDNTIRITSLKAPREPRPIQFCDDAARARLRQSINVKTPCFCAVLAQ